MCTASFTLRDAIPIAVPSALAVHQIFRAYETYSFTVHASLLILPPTAIALFLKSSAQCSLWSFLDVLPLLFIVHTITLVASVTVYRLSPFHPLARYPGPLVCRLTDFWLAYVAILGYQHWYVKSLHERYGDTVRIGPNNLSIRDPAALPSLLGASGLPKGPHYIGKLVHRDISFMAAIQDTDEHMKCRRSWARGFTPLALKGYEGQVAARVTQLVDRLKVQHGEMLLNDWFGYFSYDLLSDMAFGGGSELLEDAGKKNFWSILEESVHLTAFFEHVPWFGVYLSHIPVATAPIKALLSYASALTLKRIERGPTKHDLFYYLNHEDQPESERVPPSPRQLAHDGFLAMIAGSDTVASSLTSLFACILAHPEVYKKLQMEVDRFCPTAEDALDTKNHREMKYLNAVINETLRLYPPVPSCTQRQEPRTGSGTTVGSIYIPPGTTFWVPAWSLQRDSRNFSPAPDGFWPERWLVASRQHNKAGASLQEAARVSPLKDITTPPPAYDEGTFVHNEAAFIPFSLGPMNCVGKGLALQELRTVVCAVIQRFDIRPAREGWQLREYERDFKDYFVTVRPRLAVVLEERKSV